MLNLYKLEIFALVAKSGSFSRAAEQLLLTQPAVSQHVQDLEASVGAPLFVRGRRGATLTPAGEKLLDYTQRIFALVAEAENAVTDVTRLAGGMVRVGDRGHERHEHDDDDHDGHHRGQQQRRPVDHRTGGNGP